MSIILDSFEKQTREAFFIEVTFEEVLRSGEGIVVGSSSAEAVDVEGVDAAADVLDVGSLTVSDDLLQVRVKAGTFAKSDYKITMIAVTDQGNTWEKDILMTVEEK